MIALSVVMVVAMLWLAASLVGLVFKLFFGLVGAMFGIIGGALGIIFSGLALVVVAPLVALALLPVCLPVLLVAAVAWAIVKMFSRPAPVAVNQAPASR